jgi:hypothetical protein
MIKRYYIDTSVIGGCFDDEFKKWSNVFFDEIKKGDKIAVISDLTFRELELAPDPVKNKLNEIPINFIENIITLDEAYELADQYVKEEAISRKFLEDAIHIANATLNMVHALVSWNFKHIVNLERIKRYNAVNLKNGYYILEIRSPVEVLNPDKNED